MATRLSEEVFEGGSVAFRTYLTIGMAFTLSNLLINKSFHYVKGQQQLILVNLYKA
jgi:hypothetical protein